MLDLGYKEQYSIALKLKAKHSVLCSNIRKAVEVTTTRVENLCDFLKIKFYNSMLNWDREALKKMVYGQSIGMKMFIIAKDLYRRKINHSKIMENDTISVSTGSILNY